MKTYSIVLKVNTECDYIGEFSKSECGEKIYSMGLSKTHECVKSDFIFIKECNELKPATKGKSWFVVKSTTYQIEIKY